MDKNVAGDSRFWQYLFSPNSVALVGASEVPGSWGFNIMQRLIRPAQGFVTGNRSGNDSVVRRIYPVNPSHPSIMGISTFKSVVDIPEVVDLAVIAVPAVRVPGVMRDCVQKGIKAAVVISGGFSETDDDGKRLEAEITAIAARGGLRFVGPNTMGHANSHAQLSLLGFMGSVASGNVGFAAQSGNMGTRIMQLCMGHGIGFSKFVCTGNEAVVRLEDYLEYLGQDDTCEVLVFYIEGLREARRFLQLAKATTVRKPIVVLKSGGTKGAMKAARSHTGVLAGSEIVYAAAFKQAGVIRAESEDEVADVVAALLKQPLPRGSRVAILTMGGGFGVVAAEACEKEGLEMATLSDSTLSKLDAMLPARWPHGNPVDLAGMDAFAESVVPACMSALVDDEGVDAVLSLIPFHHAGRTPPAGFRVPDQSRIAAIAETVRTLTEKARKLGKPVLSAGGMPPFMPREFPQNRGEPKTETPRIDLGERAFANYPSPQRAARVLRQLLWYRRYLDATAGS